MKLTAKGPVDVSSANSLGFVSLPEANCIVSEAKNRLVSNGLKAPRLARRSKQTGFLSKALSLKTLKEWRLLISQKGHVALSVTFTANPRIYVINRHSRLLRICTIDSSA